MTVEPNFPHLNLAFQGAFEPKFRGSYQENADVQAIRKNPKAHAIKIRGILRNIRTFDNTVRQQRQENGLPSIPADKGFILKLPEGVDVELITKALGVELVAETEEGLMLVSSENIDFAKIEEVLSKFEVEHKGLAIASSILDIYDNSDDPRRLRNILEPQVLSLWPFDDTRIYTIDIGIQTASSSRTITWPKLRRKRDETTADFHKRREAERLKAWCAAEAEWAEKAEVRVTELQKYVQHYGGEFMTGMMDTGARTLEHGVVFPDSVQVRVKMNGAGIRDVILNFAHLFDVTLPPELQVPVSDDNAAPAVSRVEIQSPSDDAPAVCVVDSGIQEEHRWLAPAMDRTTSRCFLPGVDSNDVADYIESKGHGTRVAGAILYPRNIPKTGKFIPIAWIQNARVLDRQNQLPEALAPESYLQKVVEHFHNAPRFTKIFNHSINARIPCPKWRMSSWASKIDQLSHEKDILIIQAAGNQAIPGLSADLAAGKVPPQHQLSASMRIANPAQSLHALTVGSVSEEIFEDRDTRSFASEEFQPSGFSRSGYSEPWSVVKPEVVELGGDLVYSKKPPHIVRSHPAVAIELLNSTLHGSPAFSRDGAGTSFSTPKVAHIAAHLQTLFPETSPLLYRALIVQSARWPRWAEDTESDDVLRMIGYGIPSIERASTNSETRVTLITPEAVNIPSKQLHLYTVRIPEELRNPSLEADIRIDVTLAYTALPRRTRARRTGYLETWLDWESSTLGEPLDDFRKRMQNGGASCSKQFPWTLHKQNNLGSAQGTHRGRGSVQKDWAVFKSFEFPEELGIAVRAHKGWNHLDGAGSARYCLVVSFEAVNSKIPIYFLIESQIDIPAEVPLENEIEIQTLAQ